MKDEGVDQNALGARPESTFPMIHLVCLGTTARPWQKWNFYRLIKRIFEERNFLEDPKSSFCEYSRLFSFPPPRGVFSSTTPVKFAGSDERGRQSQATKFLFRFVCWCCNFFVSFNFLSKWNLFISAEAIKIEGKFPKQYLVRCNSLTGNRLIWLAVETYLRSLQSLKSQYNTWENAILPISSLRKIESLDS